MVIDAGEEVERVGTSWLVARGDVLVVVQALDPAVAEGALDALP